jgi:hypothetical protein
VRKQKDFPAAPTTGPSEQQINSLPEEIKAGTHKTNRFLPLQKVNNNLLILPEIPPISFPMRFLLWPWATFPSFSIRMNSSKQ